MCIRDRHKAIAQSCDTYFYGVSDQIGIDRLHDFLVQFGLGGKTGIDVLGERSGLVPSQAWKKKAFKKKELQVWFPGETVIAGIGQGYMLTPPLQLAHATATLAMRGQGFQPRLVRAVRDSRTGAVAQPPPRPLPDLQAADPGYWDTLLGGNLGVGHPRCHPHRRRSCRRSHHRCRWSCNRRYRRWRRARTRRPVGGTKS